MQITEEYKLTGQLQLRTSIRPMQSTRVAIQDGNFVDNLDVWVKSHGLIGKRVELIIKVIEQS